jgi:hypothetical protein
LMSLNSVSISFTTLKNSSTSLRGWGEKDGGGGVQPPRGTRLSRLAARRLPRRAVVHARGRC